MGLRRKAKEMVYVILRARLTITALSYGKPNIDLECCELQMFWNSGPFINSAPRHNFQVPLVNSLLFLLLSSTLDV